MASTRIINLPDAEDPSNDDFVMLDGNTGGARKLSADTFAKAASLATVATSGEYDDLTSKPTLGTAAAKDVGTGSSELADNANVIATAKDGDWSQPDADAVEQTIGDKLTATVYLEEFGARGDGNTGSPTNDTAAIQKALAAVASRGGGRVAGKIGKTYLCLGVEVPSGVIFDGGESALKAAVAGTDGFIVGFANGASDASIIGWSIDGAKAAQSKMVSGIKVRGTRVRVTGNTLIDVSDTGISIDPGCQSFDVVENVIKAPALNGIRFEFDASQVTSWFSVSRNSIFDCGAVGITFISGDGDTPSAGIAWGNIVGNRVSNTGLSSTAGGIGGYSPNNHHLLIEGNLIENVANHACHVGGDHIVVRGNICRGITNAGLMARNWPNTGGTGAPLGKNISITDNIVELTETADNGQGITVQNYSGVTVANNAVRGTVMTGIEVKGYALLTSTRCADVVIGNNRVNDITNDSDHTNTQSGIVAQYIDNLSVVGNVVRNTYNNGIRVEGCVAATIQGNVSKSSAIGAGIIIFYGDGSTDVSVVGNVCNDNATFGLQLSGAVDRAVIVGNIFRGNTTGAVTLGAATGITLGFNAGYRTRNRGMATISDGGSISHFMGIVPTSYRVTPTVAGRFVAVTAVSSSAITVALKDSAGAAVSTPEAVNWEVAAELS